MFLRKYSKCPGSVTFLKLIEHCVVFSSTSNYLPLATILFGYFITIGEFSLVDLPDTLVNSIFMSRVKCGWICLSIWGRQSIVVLRNS
jgi:hypothetical protein